MTQADPGDRRLSGTLSVDTLLELAVGAKSGQAIFSKDIRNRIAGLFQLLTDLQPHSSTGVGLMYFLEWNRQE